MYQQATNTAHKTTATKHSPFFGKGEAMPFFHPQRTANTSINTHEQETSRVSLIQRTPEKPENPVTSAPEKPITETTSKPSETTASTGQSGSSSATIPAPPPACDPTPLTRAKFLQEPGATTDDLGLTRMSGTVTNPVVSTQRIGRGKYKLQQTAAAMPGIRSAFTDEASFQEGTIIYFNNGDPYDCPGKRYPVQYFLSPDARKKIREGEIEHCSDIQLAFDMSIKKFADEINRLAVAGKIFSSQRAAEKHFEKFSGSKPSDWPSVFTCLAKKTEDRDTNKWHTPRYRRILPTQANNCAAVEIRMGGASFPEVGKHASVDVVKGCPGFP